MPRLTGRPDLGEARGAALTKLHAWRLTAYSRVVFLDADMLVLGDLTHLFDERAPLAAAPDIGWPDAFNSGLLSLPPSLETYQRLLDFAVDHGSWDGADQGLLNDFFGEALDAAELSSASFEAGTGRSDWGSWSSGSAGTDSSGKPLPASLDNWRGPGWKRLSFRHNVTPNGGYTYAPAYQRYGKSILAAHFIGAHKPWSRARPLRGNTGSPSDAVERRAVNDYDSLLMRWHDVFDAHYGSSSSSSGGASSGSSTPARPQYEVVHTERGVEVVERVEAQTRRHFVVPTYEAVWDSISYEEQQHDAQSGGFAMARGGAGSSWDSSSSSSVGRYRSGGAGAVEDLREMFAAGLRSNDRAAQSWGGMQIFRDELSAAATRPIGSSGRAEAIYFSMPIQGRLSLIPPPPLPWIEEQKRDLEAEAHESARRRTLEHEDKQRKVQSPVPSNRSSPQHQDSPRSWSPPQSAWDASKAPPPVTSGAEGFQMRNPPEAFYDNVWDQPVTSGGSGAFFPTRSVVDERIPSNLHRRGDFDNLGSDRPDPSRLKPVFPWEEQGSSARQPAPTRVFPQDSVRPRFSPQLSSQQHSSEQSSGTEYSQKITRSRGNIGALGLARGLPPSLVYANAWDEDPSIGRYAERVSSRTHSVSNAQQHQSDQGIQSGRRAHNHLQVPSGRAPPSAPSYVDMPVPSAEQDDEGDNESSFGEGVDEDEDDDSDEEADSVPEPGVSIHRRRSWRKQAPSAGYNRKAEALGFGPSSSPRSYRTMRLDNGSSSSLASGTGSRQRRTGSAQGDATPITSNNPSVGNSPPGGSSSMMLAGSSPTFSRAEMRQIQRAAAHASRDRHIAQQPPARGF